VHKFLPGEFHGAHYDAERYPSPYQERLMTVVYFLDTLPDEYGGHFIFPKAKLSVRSRSGMAIVFHNTLPDGTLDAASAHADEILLSGVKWTATQHIFARPIPLASRTVIPAFISFFGCGVAPLWMLQFRGWAIDVFGEEKGFELFNYFFVVVSLTAAVVFIAATVSTARTLLGKVTQPQLQNIRMKSS
jgi:hypothetical protein